MIGRLFSAILSGFLFSALALGPVAVQAAEARKARLYIPAASTTSVSSEEEQRITSMIAEQIVKYRLFQVLTQDSARSLMGQAREKIILDTACEEGECLQQALAYLKSRYLLRTSMLGARTRIVVSAELVDAKKSEILGKVEWSMARPLSDVSDAMNRQLEVLMQSTNQKGELVVVAEVPGSAIELGRNTHTTDENGVAKFNLAIGHHSLMLTHPDYHPYNTRLFVPFGSTVWEPDQVSYEETRQKWYASWWFWTAAAVAIGGGLTAGLLLRPDPPVAPVPQPTGTGTVIFRF